MLGRYLLVGRATLLPLFVLLAAQPAHSSQRGTLTSQERANIDALFRDYAKDTSPGCAVGVIRDGRIVYAHGYGMADLERKVPISPSSVFDIGSTSKQFTAAAALLLVHDGKLALTDDVRKYVPELPDYGAPITVDHLLHHTSGLRDYVALLLLSGRTWEEVTTDEQALRILSRQRHLNFPTGSRYEYSNSGFFLLSIIVQRVSGEPLADFARERLFTPLGMNTARIRNDYAMLVPSRALGYGPTQAGFENSMSNWQQTGDGAVQLSVEDAFKWMANFTDPKLGGPRFVAEMEQTGLLANGTPINYARGLFVDEYRGLRRVHHAGDWIGYHAMLERFPQRKTGIAIFCNADSIDPSGLADKVADIALADAFPKSSADAKRDTSGSSHRSHSNPTPPLAADRIVGSYFDRAANTVYRVTQERDHLSLELGGTSLHLVQTGPTAFAVSGFPVTVAFYALGSAPAQSLGLRIGADPEIRAQRFTPLELSEQKLRTYTGLYRSDELGVTWPIGFGDGRLAIQYAARTSVPVSGPLRPAMADAFSAPVGFLQFVRDASGRLTGFDLSASRMRNIHFELAAPARSASGAR